MYINGNKSVLNISDLDNLLWH